MSDMTPEQISKALDAGIISKAQAKAMRAKQAARPPAALDTPSPASTPDAPVIGNEDDMRFLRSFSDVFIAIGIGLFALGLSALAAIFGGGVSFIGAAIIMAGVAHYFGRKRRAHLPTLISALAFLLFTQRGVGALIGDIGLGGDILTALITLGAMLLFYIRIRLPFCIALIAIAALYLVFAVLGQIAPSFLKSQFGFVLLACGLAVFAAALLYDMRDAHRTTRFADNAFWLHFLAAPLIIHGLALKLVTLKQDMLFNLIPMVSLDRSDAALVMVMVGFITLVGLAINRRALIVSSLGYAAFAIGYLFDGTGMGFGAVMAVTFLLLGAAVVFLGAGWHTVRNWLLKFLPKLPVFPPPFDPDYKP
jgi:hypothetical protein